MFEWLSEQYLDLISNYRILLENPAQCGTVDVLRLFTYTLFAIFLAKLAVHLVIFTRLKLKFSKYSQEMHPHLFHVYRNAAQKVNVHRLPLLYQFNNERPLIFTIGSLRPAIFLAPRLAENMQREELEAALVHELTHIKRHDNLLVWLLEIFFVSIPVLVIQVFAMSFVFSLENSVYAIVGSLALVTVFKAFILKRILYLRELSCDDLSVDAIKDPLTLASSLINVWRIGNRLPRHRWQGGLTFTQTLLPASASPQSRIRRLLDYRRPWLKFFLGKAVRIVALLLAVFSVGFLWRFYSVQDHQQFDLDREGENATVDYVCASSGEGEFSAAPTDQASNNRFTTVMSDYARMINAQDYHGMQNHFAAEIRDSYPSEKFELLPRALLYRLGKIQNLDHARLIQANKAVVPVHFERGILNIQVTLDDQDKIACLWFAPTFNDYSQLTSH